MVSEMINYKQGEKLIFLPNEIFNDLNYPIRHSRHKSFAYSYYYLISYLFRFAKYSYEQNLQQKTLKKILGYSPNAKEIDYIIKKDGVLDNIGYTKTINDFPMFYEMDNNSPTFTMYSDFKKENLEEMKYLGIHNMRNYKTKFPVKAFYRSEFAEINDYKNGTFFEFENTHNIPVQMFIDIMENDLLECMGFYLAGYLKMNIDKHHGRYAVSIYRIAKEIGMSHEAVNNYKERLCQLGFINIDRKNFHNGEVKIPNVYYLGDAIKEYYV